MKLSCGVKEETYKAVRGFTGYWETAAAFCCKHTRLLGCRNQSVAFQVVLMADEDCSLSVTESAHFDKQGIINNVRLKATLDCGDSPLAVGMQIIGFVEDDDRLLKADILLPQESIHVDRNSIQPVWVEISIPKDAIAQLYHGKVEIFTHKGFDAETKIDEVSFDVDVKDITLPDPSDYRFHLDLWQHNSNIARKHEVKIWSDGHFAILDKYVASLAALGQKAVSVVVSEIPWSGQFCYRDSAYPSDLYEYSMINVHKDMGGLLKLDFTALDRYIGLCFSHGIDREIEAFGLLNIWMCEEEGFGRVVKKLSDGVRVRCLDASDNCYKYIDTVHELEFYIQSIERHFVEKGVIDKVRIVADEPADIGVFNERMAFLKKTAPLFKYKAAVDHAEFIDSFNGEITDFVPDFTAVCRQADKMKTLRAGIGGRLCWYVCCGPEHPNTFIRSHLLESWAIGLLTEYMGMDGFLRWDYTAWPERPRDRISYHPQVWPAGDTCFVYPSGNGTPLLTLRYKALLKGIQLFELLQILKKMNPDYEAAVSEVFHKVFRFGSLGAFDNSRKQNAEELMSVEYKDYSDALALILGNINAEGE